ncbi:hypothetical protein BGX29_003834 [Mortierella sp. GBA35]|nr:hypothetical protein BGX29_003834 [Mortierella sp. GBA35]
MNSNSVTPQSDVKVFKDFPVRHNALPIRDIFDVQIIDSQTGTPQVLDSLQRSGPLQFKGWVPTKHTKYFNAEDPHRRLYIVGEIVEWSHKYDRKNPKRPIFWLKSGGVGWYKIESVLESYEPYFTPLVKACSYLDVLVQLVFQLRMKDDLRILIPKMAVVLAEPESMVTRMLQKHRSHLLELSISDSAIRGSNFFKTWVAEQAAESSGRSYGEGAPTSPFDLTMQEVHEEEQQIIADIETDNDAYIDIESHHDDDNHDNAPPPPPPVIKEPLLPIISYDMADREVIPEHETAVESYEELPAPCVEDVCYMHPNFEIDAFNALSQDLQLLFSKFAPPPPTPTVKVKIEGRSGSESEAEPEPVVVSEAGSFFCPVQGCVTTICNTTIPTTEEFVAAISQHLGTHDLSKGDTERALRTYLAKPWKMPARPKAWDTTAKQLNTKTPTLNLHLYWMLNSKDRNQKALTPLPPTNPTRSTISRRKRTTSQATVQTTPSSSSTSSPRSTPSGRTAQAVTTTSVAQYSETTEATSTTSIQQFPDGGTSVIESTCTSLVRETITTSTMSVTNRGASVTEKSRSRRREREATDSSSGRRESSKRRAQSNGDAISGDEDIRPGRKRQRGDQEVLVLDSGSEGDTQTGMSTPRRSGRSESRGKAMTERSNRSQSRGRASASVNETEYTRQMLGRSKSKGRRIESDRFDHTDDDYSRPISDIEMEMDHVESTSFYNNYNNNNAINRINESSRSRLARDRGKAGRVPESNESDSLLSEYFGVYRVPKNSQLETITFMRCFKCQGLTTTQDGHPKCRGLGSEVHPVVLTVD